MAIEVRTARHADWEAIERLLSDADLPVKDLSEAACEQFAVYVDDAQVQGAVALEALAPGQGLLRSLVVSPAVRQSGIGNRLVQHIEELARSRGVANLYLLTTTADRYFAKLGYLPIDREGVPPSVKAHEQFRSLCPSSAVVMSKGISPTE